MDKTKTEIEEEQRRHIQDALAFIDISDEGLIVELQDNLVMGKRIVAWVVPSENIAGSYELGDPGFAKVSVIMALGMIRHRYHKLIYDIILMTDEFLHPGGGNRNNVLEIALRAAIAHAMSTMPMSHVMPYIERTYHFVENLEEMKEVYVLMQERKKQARKGNGKVH